MPTADDLYRDILDFLARGTGPHDLSAPPDITALPDWNQQAQKEAPTARHLFPQLLPLTTIGSGELAVQAALFSHLLCKQWNAVTEAAPDQSSDRIDILILDRLFNPLALIELKHYSIHQPWDPKNTNRPSELLRQMDNDLTKRVAQSIYGTPISTAIPLIRVGLMTAIVSPSAQTLRTTSNLFPSFLRKVSYIGTGSNDTLSAFSKPWSSNTSAGRFEAFLLAVHRWYKSSSSTMGNAGWGPNEVFSHGPGKTDIEGYVGYVCVMT